METKNIQEWTALVAAWNDQRAWIISAALVKSEILWNQNNDNNVAVPDKQISSDDISKNSIDADAFTAFTESIGISPPTI